MLYKTFYTNRIIPARFGGFVIGPVILIRPKYRGDQGLLEHEKIHVWQFWRTFGVYPLVYFLSAKWRLRWEVEAYREQLKYYDKDLTRKFAGYLATKYRLDISIEDAETLLSKK